MKLNTFFQYSIVLLCTVTVTIGENYYSIIAPGVLKSNRKYTVAVTWHDSHEPCTISISILGRLFNATDQVVLQPFETKHLDFFPPKLDGQDYQLLAKGLSGCAFQNETKLFSDNLAGPKIYTQTDKAVYKPLDLVQFRVVILDEHTRPINIREPIRVEILLPGFLIQAVNLNLILFCFYLPFFVFLLIIFGFEIISTHQDSAGNRVKQFKDISLTKGVFTSKFKLAEQPVMGDWEIKTVLSGKYSHQKSKNFKVLLYTLPKFSVFVNMDKNVLVDDPIVKAEIYGKYTFGKYVEGFLHVKLDKVSNNELIQQQFHLIDGLLILEFPLQNVTNLHKETLLKLEVALEEKHTGVQSNTTVFLNVHKIRYKISVPYDEVEYRNSKPFRLKAHIEDFNEGPVWDTNTPAILEHGTKKYETYLNDEGTALFEFEHQENALFTVSFKGAKIHLPTFQLYKERKEDFYCKLVLKERPRLGKPLEVEVRSSFHIPYLVYIVVGHASIVKVELVKVPFNRKSHKIIITPSIEMVPTSFLYVHYILDGNFRYEELTLYFPEELENPISIEAPLQVKPGKEVTLKLKAEPKSYVSILAVDLGVYLLDNSYDIYKSKIIEDLNEDRSYVHDGNIERPGILSGLITLTNAHHPIQQKYDGGAKGSRQGDLDFREKFPETWIFENYEINNTDTEIVLNIPETITTWRITAFSNHAIKGFGVVDMPTDITTFLPFFVSLNLPYKVKRNEVVAIAATIFNYHKQAADTKVTLYNELEQFEFMEPTANSTSTANAQQTKSTQIPANAGKTVQFLIKPLKIGEIEIRVAANSSVASDGVLQYLNVVPEGITKYLNEARYVSAADKKSSLTLDIPRDSVSDSEVITLTVGGDFMIPSLENFNEMVNLPTGCGEQNMINFAPNVLVLQYLRATGKQSQHNNLVNEAKVYTDIGYQQQLWYRHIAGGYSVFGEDNSREASTWLTAYVIRFFIKGSKFAPIEARIIDSDLKYLSNQQRYDGSFPYTGYLFYKELENKHGLTAFVLLTFMEDRRYARKYQRTIRKGLEFISSNLPDVNDVYSLAIIAAALSKAKHNSTDRVMEKLEDYRHRDQNGLMWWSGSGNDVETTAYVLMALINMPGNHFHVLKWLIEQRNSQGGFKSTQDTVVGLEALVKFAQKYNNASSWNMKIAYSAQDYEGNEVKINEFLVTQNNALTLQQHELPKSVRKINFEITGNGYSLVQLSSQFNIKNDFQPKYFMMKVNPNRLNDDELDLEVCFTYHALNAISNSTNMVILEANMPSGFKIEAQFNRDLIDNDFIQRVESKNEETAAILYFDKLSTDVPHCVTFEAFRAHEVTETKPSAIVMYDYYNTNRTNTLFYQI